MSISTIPKSRASTNTLFRDQRPTLNLEITEGRYGVKLAETSTEIESALRLRFEVFKLEIAGSSQPYDPSRLEFDEYDFRCRHLIVVDRTSGRTVGTYRLNSIELGAGPKGFYSYSEFTLEDLPEEVLDGGVEIGRACIASDHRNTKVLFLLWKGMAAYLQTAGKRFFFGCCSIFTRDADVGTRAYWQLSRDGHFHDAFRVQPRQNALHSGPVVSHSKDVELPSLFNMYLRIGAKVCSPPVIDEEFGTIDFFVVCDTQKISGKYRRMFFG